MTKHCRSLFLTFTGVLLVVAQAVADDTQEAEIRSSSSPAVEVTSFETDKILYESGESVRFHTVVRLNSRSKSGAAPTDVYTFEVWDEDDFNPPVLAGRVVVSRSSLSESRSVSLASTLSPAEYGHQAELRILDSRGRLVARASTLYEVTNDWPKLLRMAPTIAYRLAGEHIDDEYVLRQIAYFRRAFINAVELFAWQGVDNRLDPRVSTWSSLHYTDPDRPKVSADRIRALARLLQERGIRLVGYHQSAILNPSILPPDEDPEAFKIYQQTNAGRTLIAPYLSDLGCFMPNALRVAPLVAEQLRESVRMFNWDGLLTDTATQTFLATSTGADSEGRPLTPLSPGAVGTQYLRTLRTAVDDVKPGFKFIVQNAGASMMLREQRWKSANREAANAIEAYARTNYDELFPYVDSWSAELDPHYAPADQYPSTYDKLALVLNVVRDVSRTPVTLYPYIASPWDGEYSPAYAKPYLATLAATGATWSDHFAEYGGWWGTTIDAPVNAAQIQIHRFVLRYGLYIRDRTLRWVRNPERRFRVNAPRGLFWRDTVYRRERDGAKETIIHFRNLDSPQIRAPKTVPQPAAASVMDRAPTAAAAARTSAYFLDAENPELRHLAIEPRVQRDHLTFDLPAVRSWAILVIRHPAHR